MDFGHSLIMGFQVAFQPINLLFCFMGVRLEPWWGPPWAGARCPRSLCCYLPHYHVPRGVRCDMAGRSTMAPCTGGSTNSILLNLPGRQHPSSLALTVFKWHAREEPYRPRHGSPSGLFIAGTLGLVGLMLIAPPLRRLPEVWSTGVFFS